MTHLVLVDPLIGQNTTYMKIGANSRKMSKINFCWFHSSKSWHFEWMMGVTMGSNHINFNFFFNFFFTLNGVIIQVRLQSSHRNY